MNPKVNHLISRPILNRILNVQKTIIFFFLISLIFMYMMCKYLTMSTRNTDSSTPIGTEIGPVVTPRPRPFDDANESSFESLTNESWYTFLRFIDPDTQYIHSNATWFSLSLLDKSHEQINPKIIDEDLEDRLSEQLKQENISIQMGGYYSPYGPIDPGDCFHVNQTLAILIPYRNRAQNLISFLSFMHRYLPLKSVSYRLVVLEQNNSKPFNRAKLFNAGLRELGLLIEEGKRPTWEDDSTSFNCTHHCFVLHDVDKLPVSRHAPYDCYSDPWQLARIAVARNRSAGVRGNVHLHKDEGERRLYDQFFGGVTVVNKPVLLLVNGLSNSFYGWGGEDDDFRQRMRLRKVRVRMAPLKHARFYYLDHDEDSKYNQRIPVLFAGNRVVIRMRFDGIRQTRYAVSQRIVRPLYTLYKINV